MQFLESSMLGLRSAFYQFTSPDHALKFYIFPMVHIGLPAYYQTIVEDLKVCDNVIFAGVKSKKVWLNTQAYKLTVKKKSLGLITQNQGLPLKKILTLIFFTAIPII